MLKLELRFDTNDKELLDFNNFYTEDDLVFIDDSFSINPIGTLLLTFLNTNFENYDEFVNFFMKYGPFGYKSFFKKSFPKFIDSTLAENITYFEFKELINKFYLQHKNGFIGFQLKLINLISYTYNLDKHKDISNLKPLERYYLAAKKYDFNYSMDVNVQTTFDTISNSTNQYKKIFITSQSEKNLIPSSEEGTLSVYHAKFIVRRDYEILNYYKQHKD